MKSYQSVKTSAAFQLKWKRLKMKAKTFLILLLASVKIWAVAMC